ncbi:MAG TPA: chalcone isomerase family protein [Desulfobacter sp.]|nr:chalcone isomerase family protein [Desulfobacter sp.]
MKIKISKSIATSLICILISANVYASVTMIDGTGFSNSIDVQKSRLYLKGAALLRYWIFVEAYAGALYLPKNSNGDQALDDIMKSLELEYRVAISADDFARATRQKIKETVSNSTFNRLLPKIETLNRLYKSVRPGDRYALTYVPGEGTQLIYNSTLLGRIEGADFATALFGIWIGDDPIDKGFRDKLLGKE